MTRVTSLSGLLQIMNATGEEEPGLRHAWESTEDSVREYCDLINRALDRSSKKGAGIEQSCLLRIFPNAYSRISPFGYSHGWSGE